MLKGEMEGPHITEGAHSSCGADDMVMVMPTKESPARALLSPFFSHFPIGLHVLYVLVKHTVPGTAPCPRLSATGQTQCGLTGAFFWSAWGRLAWYDWGQVRPRGIVRCGAANGERFSPRRRTTPVDARALTVKGHSIHRLSLDQSGTSS